MTRAETVLREHLRRHASDAELAAMDAVVDFDQAEATCPACGARFRTEHAACPDCGLRFG